MVTDTSALEALCTCVEVHVGRKMKGQSDFAYLSDCISQKVHFSVSPTTLKRLWGRTGQSVQPHKATLDALAQFCDAQDWDSFCQQVAPEPPAPPEPQPPHETPSSTADVALPPQRPHQKLRMAAVVVAVVVFSLLGVWYGTIRNSESGFILHQGQRFSSYDDYLRLFGILDAKEYPYFQVLPHYEHIILWGPEYHHPHWGNEGSRDSLMPTITERWEPEGVSPETIVMRNAELYHAGRRLNDVRLTFMKNLLDTGFVFLGVYRFSLQRSDTTHIVWERVATECDLNNLSYLEELRN